jgi:hypothetical protein
MIKFIDYYKLSEDEDTVIIQLSSSSGRDIEFFIKKYPKLKYISTDVNEEILNFQKENYNYNNLKYFKCHAEDIDICLQNFNIYNKKIILFSVGSLQYVNPLFLPDFFFKLTYIKKLNFFLEEPTSLNFIDHAKKISDFRGNVSFSHRYCEYARNSKINILEKIIIRPYLIGDKQHGDTGHFYLHTST